jgi:hypothetical protein
MRKSFRPKWSFVKSIPGQVETEKEDDYAERDVGHVQLAMVLAVLTFR